MQKNNKTSKAQIKASTKWNQNNKDKVNHIRNRSAAKKYIANANFDELQEIKNMVETREKELNK